MSTIVSERPTLRLNSPDVMRRVNALRQTDNWRNWFYLAREYLYLGGVAALAIGFYIGRADWGLHWLWNVPVTILAVTLIGAGQHRLTTLAHEASHYMLFRNRKLNELTSDFFCMFAVWSTTHHYRLQHMAHHQFPNDPERDPDVKQMMGSGHRFRFPMSPRRFVWECVLKQILWLPGLVRYTRMRARYASTGGGGGPYESSGGGRKSRVLILIGILYLAALAGALTLLTWLQQPLLMALVPAAMLAAALTFYLMAPGDMFRRSTVRCDVSPRQTTLFRVTYLTGVFTALAWLTYLTHRPWALYYIVLWLVPLGTSFSFCMLLRQIVQHGNAGGERFTNTRIFLVSRLIRFGVFPLGMDWHLPHHLFPMVPHYRLEQLHELLLETEEYRQNATTVEGYFWHDDPPQHPTVLELMATDRGA
ncbi:MAG TPA: fatty acid desaturase [Gemmataceae bacterium]|nr:fatty acid desaturase [Gemmataceae bacterium]